MAWGEEYEAEMKEPKLGMAKNPTAMVRDAHYWVIRNIPWTPKP